MSKGVTLETEMSRRIWDCESKRQERSRRVFDYLLEKELRQQQKIIAETHRPRALGLANILGFICFRTASQHPLNISRSTD